MAFESSAGPVSFEAAPKKRGRPKTQAKPAAKKRGRPPKPEPPEVEPPQPEYAPPPIDINAVLGPLMQAYMANSHMQQRQVKAQRNREMVRSIFSRQHKNFA